MPSFGAASRSFGFPPGRGALTRFATAPAHRGAEQQRKAEVIFALAPGVGHVARWRSPWARSWPAHDAYREQPVRAHEPSSSRPIAPALTVVGRERSHARSARGTLGRALGIASGSLPTSTLARTDSRSPSVVPRPGASRRTSLCYGTRDGACAGRAPGAASVPTRDPGSHGLPGVDDRSCSG
jgi:hypothetical protein